MFTYHNAFSPLSAFRSNHITINNVIMVLYYSARGTYLKIPTLSVKNDFPLSDSLDLFTPCEIIE